METKKLVEILDKNVNQEQLLKDVMMEFALPEIEKIKAKVLSKEIDLIPGTDMDNVFIVSVIDGLIAKLKA